MTLCQCRNYYYSIGSISSYTVIKVHLKYDFTSMIKLTKRNCCFQIAALYDQNVYVGQRQKESILLHDGEYYKGNIEVKGCTTCSQSTV